MKRDPGGLREYKPIFRRGQNLCQAEQAQRGQRGDIHDNGFRRLNCLHSLTALSSISKGILHLLAFLLSEVRNRQIGIEPEAPAVQVE